MNSEGLRPFGAALQADVVVLRHGLAAILGIAEKGLSIDSKEVADLKTSLTLIVGEAKQALEDEEIARSFIHTNPPGGFDGEPKIEWDKS